MKYEDELIVISSYPPKGQTHGKHVVGIASYTKNTLLSLKKINKNLKITVLAETLKGEKTSCEENGITIKRIWKRNSFKTFTKLLHEVIKKRNKKIIIELELAMFGEKLYLLPFPVFLFTLKLFGKKTYIVLHQVVSDINNMHGHMNIEEKSIQSYLINFLIHWFYKISFSLCNKIIVFEDVLKEDLVKFTDLKKVEVIPHGIEDLRILDKVASRKKLKIQTNKFVVFYFGFVSWYKGPELLIEEVKKRQSSNVQLVIGGGPNPNHLKKKFYRNYVEKIKNECRKNGFIFTDFIEEKDIPLYFSASDLVVFPYRTMFSSSGPLSLAFSFKKPILLSNNLKDYFKSQDFKNALEKSKIKKEDFLFEFNNGSTKNDFSKKIEVIRKNIKKFSYFSTTIREERNWDKIGAKYNEVLA